MHTFSNSFTAYHSPNPVLLRYMYIHCTSNRALVHYNSSVNAMSSLQGEEMPYTARSTPRDPQPEGPTRKEIYPTRPNSRPDTYCSIYCLMFPKYHWPINLQGSTTQSGSLWTWWQCSNVRLPGQRSCFFCSIRCHFSQVVIIIATNFIHNVHFLLHFSWGTPSSVHKEMQVCISRIIWP
jgi:hypothetical protein